MKVSILVPKELVKPSRPTVINEYLSVEVPFNVYWESKEYIIVMATVAKGTTRIRVTGYRANSLTPKNELVPLEACADIPAYIKLTR